MKINFVIKTIFLTIFITLIFSGCSQKLENDLFVVDKKYKSNNSATKVYYVDNNYESTREQLNKLVDELNSNELIPNILIESVSLNGRKFYYEPTLLNIFTSSHDIKKGNKKPLDFKFKLDENSNYIVVANKEYESQVDAYTDYENIIQVIWEKWLSLDIEKRDEFGLKGSVKSYFLDEIELSKNKTLKFTTLKDKVRDHYAPLIKKQLEDGGFIFVDNPEEADKIIELEFVRDYNNSEIRELRKTGKAMDVKLVNAKSDLTGAQTAMSIAGSSSSSSSFGAGVGLGFALIGALIPDDSQFVPIFIKVIDKKNNKEYMLNSMSATNSLVYRTKFMSDEIYIGYHNSDIRNQQLSRIQRNIYNAIIKDLTGYQKNINNLE